MLPFLSEQNNEINETQEHEMQDNSAQNCDTDSQQQEYLTVSAREKEVSKTNCILGVFFVLSLLCLWFMIKKSAPQTASAANATLAIGAETQIEAAIGRLTGVKAEMVNQMDEILKKFYAFSDVRQIKTSELIKNPFRAERFSGSPRRNLPLKEPGNNVEMQLLSIMSTDSGVCCMINDRILYEGDLIRNFTVKHIGNDFVKLRSQQPMGSDKDSVDVELILKLAGSN